MLLQGAARRVVAAPAFATLARASARRAVMPARSRRHLTVAVTGASGYVGSYITEELLKRGHDVRALVRGCDSNKEKAAHLRALPGADRLTLVDGGDLSIQGSFEAGLAGADAVVHAAATVVIGRDPSIASAAVDGVENVLSSLPATCKTFVLTSSIAAVISLDKASLTFDESDWNDYSSLSNGDAYGYGKTRAERRARDHCKNINFVALHPGIVLGPVMTKPHTKASPVFVRNLLLPKPILNPDSAHFVDVRDVAAAHCIAVERASELDGGRFILCNDETCESVNPVSLGEVAAAACPEYEYTADPLLPPWKFSLAKALSYVPVLGPRVMTEYERRVFEARTTLSNARAKTELGLTFRPHASTVADTVRGCVQLGIAHRRA